MVHKHQSTALANYSWETPQLAVFTSITHNPRAGRRLHENPTQ